MFSAGKYPEKSNTKSQISKNDTIVQTSKKPFQAKLAALNPRDIKREDQKRNGYVWFATYTADLVIPNDMRKALYKLED